MGYLLQITCFIYMVGRDLAIVIRETAPFAINKEADLQVSLFTEELSYFWTTTS